MITGLIALNMIILVYVYFSSKREKKANEKAAAWVKEYDAVCRGDFVSQPDQKKTDELLVVEPYEADYSAFSMDGIYECGYE